MENLLKINKPFVLCNPCLHFNSLSLFYVLNLLNFCLCKQYYLHAYDVYSLSNGHPSPFSHLLKKAVSFNLRQLRHLTSYDNIKTHRFPALPHGGLALSGNIFIYVFCIPILFACQINKIYHFVIKFL